WCPVDDREVFQDDVVRAFEYTKDQYIEITEEDLENLPVASKHTIELTSFVKASDIDPVYFERTYYLEPDQVGAKPYALLMAALKASLEAAKKGKPAAAAAAETAPSRSEPDEPEEELAVAF